MNIKNRISRHCKYLSLNAIGEQIQSLADNTSKEGISYLDFAARVLDVEIEHRQDREVLNKIRIARLPVNHDLKHYDCTAVEGMPISRL